MWQTFDLIWCCCLPTADNHVRSKTKRQCPDFQNPKFALCAGQLCMSEASSSNILPCWKHPVTHMHKNLNEEVMGQLMSSATVNWSSAVTAMAQRHSVGHQCQWSDVIAWQHAGKQIKEPSNMCAQRLMWSVAHCWQRPILWQSGTTTTEACLQKWLTPEPCPLARNRLTELAATLSKWGKEDWSFFHFWPFHCALCWMLDQMVATHVHNKMLSCQGNFILHWIWCWFVPSWQCLLATDWLWPVASVCFLPHACHQFGASVMCANATIDLRQLCTFCWSWVVIPHAHFEFWMDRFGTLSKMAENWLKQSVQTIKTHSPKMPKRGHLLAKSTKTAHSKHKLIARHCNVAWTKSSAQNAHNRHWQQSLFLCTHGTMVSTKFHQPCLDSWS